MKELDEGSGMSPDVFNQIISHFDELAPHEQEQLVQELTDAIARRGGAATRRSILELQGLGKEIWRGIDAGEYVRQERASWPG